ncbi:Thermonuclease [Staphylococcus aureus]|nr:Thermonuclease [Staphylococcus aureus]
MKSNKSLAMIVVAIIIVGVLAFQFMNHTGPFKKGTNHETVQDLMVKIKYMFKELWMVIHLLQIKMVKKLKLGL